MTQVCNPHAETASYVLYQQINIWGKYLQIDGLLAICVLQAQQIVNCLWVFAP